MFTFSTSTLNAKKPRRRLGQRWLHSGELDGGVARSKMALSIPEGRSYRVRGEEGGKGGKRESMVSGRREAR